MATIEAKATICTIGDEILLGQIQDTNSQWIAEKLVLEGIDPVLRISVGDNPAHIQMALANALSVSGIVIITGGLGPTKDDLTKKILADFVGCSLSEHPQALKDLEEKLRKRGRDMNDLVRTQALHPEGADYLPNKVGTAPGIWIVYQNAILVALPGVPYEMKQLIADEVLPRLRQAIKLPFIRHRFFRTAAVPETHLAQAMGSLEDELPAELKLAYLPSGGQVKLRLTGRGPDASTLDNLLKIWGDKILNKIRDWVYSEEDLELHEVLIRRLLQTGKRVYLEDQTDNSKLKIWLEPVSVSSYNPEAIWLKLSNRKDESGEELIRLELRNKDNTEPEVQQFRPFPVPDIAENMVALRSLEMIRRTLA